MAKTPTKDKIIAAAQELMRSQGYSATTVDSIVKFAGVSKGSFYHAFVSKQALAEAALEDWAVRGWWEIASGPYRQVYDPVERALQFIDYIEQKSDTLWARGSLLGTVAVEVAESYPAMQAHIAALYGQLEDEFVAILEPALASAEVSQFNARDVAAQLLASIEGAIICARTQGDAQYVRRCIAQFRHYLTLLLKSA